MARRILREAINVEGATYIASANGYDLFDITTYEAAQQFVNARNNNPAGSDWVQNEAVFNANINDRVHLYFFANADTNQVQYGVIMGVGIRNQHLTIGYHGNGNIDLSTNFGVENASNHQAAVPADDKVPFYLLPDYSVDEYVDDNGCYFIDDLLEGVLPQFCHSTVIERLEFAPRIHNISAHAFKFGQHIESLILDPAHITDLPCGVISSNIDHVYVKDVLETPDNWDPRWNHIFEDRTEFGFGVSPEVIAQREAEIRARQEREAEEARLERERQEREAQLAAEREARKIRYKVEGKSITIKGTRKGVKELVIPAEIEGLPVTKIEAYAFYDHATLQRLILPDTIKLIERGATLGCDFSSYVRVPSTCVVGKDNPYVRKR